MPALVADIPQVAKRSNSPEFCENCWWIPPTGKRFEHRKDMDAGPVGVPRRAAEQSLAPGARASNNGCLAMTVAEYLQLLDWTGRQIRRNKQGAIPAKLAPILERLSVTSDGWLKLVTEFSRLFRQSAGTPTSLGKEAAKWGRKRREGISHSRAVLGSPRT